MLISEPKGNWESAMGKVNVKLHLNFLPTFGPSNGPLTDVLEETVSLLNGQKCQSAHLAYTQHTQEVHQSSGRKHRVDSAYYLQT